MTWRAVLIFAILLQACSQKVTRLDNFGTVPHFQLTAQTGQPFDSRLLAGKIWIADFIFTNCPGPCPRMTSKMHQVQEAVLKMPDVRLVSFTVDPVRDTPAVLAAYAQQHHASPEHWSFLTGSQATLNDLCRNAFKLGFVDGSLAHTTRFVLVDRKSQVRATYDTSEPDSIEKLVADVHALAQEKN